MSEYGRNMLPAVSAFPPAEICSCISCTPAGRKMLPAFSALPPSLAVVPGGRPWRSENDRFVGNKSGHAQRARRAQTRDGLRLKCDFRFSLGTSLCLAARRRPAAVPIGCPADWSSFSCRSRSRKMAVLSGCAFFAAQSCSARSPARTSLCGRSRLPFPPLTLLRRKGRG